MPRQAPHEKGAGQVGEGLIGALHKIYHGAAGSGGGVGLWTSKRPLPVVQDFRVIESNIFEPEASPLLASSSANSLASTVSFFEGSRTSSLEAPDAALPPMRSPELPIEMQASRTRKPAKRICEECSAADSIANGECQICGAAAKVLLEHHRSVPPSKCDSCKANNSMVELHSGVRTCQVCPVLQVLPLQNLREMRPFRILPAV